MGPKILYKISVSDGWAEYPYYVIARSVKEAYNKLKKHLDDNNYLDDPVRKLKPAEVIAKEAGVEIFG